MDPIQQTQQTQQGSNKAVKLATPEQKQQLLDLIEATRGKLSEFNATSFAAKNQGEADKNEALKQIFSILQSAGVDLSNPQSVADFFSRLRVQNPEMSQMLEQALNQILGGDDQQEEMLSQGGIPQEMMPPGM